MHLRRYQKVTPKKDERRSRAEQKLAGRRTDITGLSQVELERIVHELEGHQIELQIQNEELERQKELFKRMYDYIPVMLILWDPALRRFTLNNYAEDLLGWTTEEANRGDFMSMVYPDPDYRRRVEEYMKSLDTGWQEWEVTTREGARIPSEWANVWLADDTMIGIGVDLRERKQAEEDLSKAREELLASIRERNRELSEVEKKTAGIDRGKFRGNVFHERGLEGNAPAYQRQLPH
jgi:PAS domain S-box-containing protein